MKQLLSLLFIFIFSLIKGFSQNCNSVTVSQLPGTWKEGMKNPSTGYAEAAVIAKAKKNMEAFHNLVRSKYSPVGLQAAYAFSRINKESNLKLYTYSYSLYFHPFSCNKNTVTPTFDFMGKLRMFVNPGFFFQGGGLDFMVEKDHLQYGWIDKIPVQKNGIWDFGEIDDVDGNATYTTDYKSHQWLITYDGKLPFQYVSRLEFLQKKKAGVQKEKQEAITDTKERIPIRPRAEQDKEKEDALKKIKEDAAKGRGDWTRQFLRNYQTDEQKQEEAIRKMNKYFDDQLHEIDVQLQLPEKELQQPAIMKNGAQGFVKEGETGVRILVKENPDYYNKKLPNSAVQLIMVNLSCDFLYPALSKAYTDLTKAIDFTMLKNMLGK